VDETPNSLGLYTGCYTIVFHPGESWRAACADKVKANPCLCSHPGINYVYREICNDMMMVEYHSGESEMSDEENEHNL
jgi:hypothetical protein